MKKLILLFLMISGLNTYAQNLPPTIIEGSLIAKDTLRAEKDVYVGGGIGVQGKMNVKGLANLSGGTLTSNLMIGTKLDNISISTLSLPDGAKVLAFGFAGPIRQLPTTCVKPYNSSSVSIFKSRAAVVDSGSANMLDFNNDGLNGFIDYGYDIGLHLQPIADTTPPAPIPALKINSMCYGDVEIAKGGGYVATGNYLEVGNPVRNYGIAVNVNAPGRVGQRTTVSSSYPESAPAPPDAYNTQLFVNRKRIKALAVINTSTNPGGDQTFVVYGNGKTHIGTGRPLATGVCPNAMLSVDGTILAKEVRVAISTATHWADYVFDDDYKLMPLKEVEAYVTTNKHLPDVPSAQDVDKNGVAVAEISAVLLKKIEELTLYTIQLQKDMEVQQKEINILKKHRP